jgi:hypothetical protein
MHLSRVDRARLEDSRLKIQSVVKALDGVESGKLPRYNDIHECLCDAEKSIALALRAARSTE